MDLLCGPAAHRHASVQKNLQQADDTDIGNADTGIADGADGEGQGETLEKREVHMHIQSLGLKASEAIGDELKLLAHGVEMIESFAQAEIRQIIGEQLVA